MNDRKRLKFMFILFILGPLACSENRETAGNGSGMSNNNDPEFNESSDPNWYGSNAARLQEMIEDLGEESASYDPDSPPEAVFDWDNTIAKNDVGDITMFWMLNHNLIKQPFEKNWYNTSELLTPEAIDALNTACDSQGEEKQPLTTDQSSATSKACADEIVTIYYDGTTVSGDAAWNETAFDEDTMEPAYAWAVQLQARYTPDEVRAIARDAIDAALVAEIGAKQTVGTGEYNAYLRIYEQIKDLIGALQGNGFDVWIISASSQYLVEEFAKGVGVSADRVIGVRAVLNSSGKTTAYFEGCGTAPDGNQELITYKVGKRCWLNKEVFELFRADDMMEIPTPIEFAAGDSDTDITFVKDATELKLAINRNKKELMCNAYADLYSSANPDGKWLVNPMFIEPKGQYTKDDGTHTYSCSGFDLEDQVDSIFVE